MLALLGAAKPALAQADAGASDASPSSEDANVVPPKLLVAAQPEFPEPARAAGIPKAEVVLRITVGVDGSVTNPEVTEPAGHGFDDAAVSAALAYRFQPALRGDSPVASRVLLKVTFELPPAAPAPSAEPAPGPAPPPNASAAPRAAALPPSASTEVSVAGLSEADRLRRSSEAVHVVETETAQRQTADLGEVLARTQGVAVQRAGGLGSETRFSLNGLTDDQIRFFLDGVPLEFAGYPFGIANVPVNLVERVELYRGVVPIRFGADALGGAVNLVSDQQVEGTHGSASLQGGSFGTYRATVSVRHLDDRSGWFTRVNAFADHADNDYPMDRLVPNDVGREVPARVYRFHDAYSAQGANVETGLVRKTWARKLLLRAFVTSYDKEIQHNLLMTSFSPYGDVKLAETSAGATLRYENTLARRVVLNTIAGYVHTATTYQDLGECVYDWFGRCLSQRAQPGERRGRAEDQLYGEHAGFARASATWRLSPSHAVTFSTAPTFVTRTGDERRQANLEARDPLSAERRLLTVISALEYQTRFFDERLENTLFAKDYLQLQRSEEPLSTGVFRRLDRETHRFGAGDSLRYTLADWVYAKASYEWATRLPNPEEVFGNAFPVQPNLRLRPEVSHNVNVGVTANGNVRRLGRLRCDVNGFLRVADELIVLIGDDEAASYQNVYSARSLGVEGALGWTSPGEYLALDANVTWVDFRNTSTDGAFARNTGERIPNRPYLFGTGVARLQKRAVAAPEDELSLSWATRYVHAFYRGWEDIGTFKLEVEAQLVHSIALTYLVRGEPTALGFTAEVQNVTDAPAFDVFGVPRPGRAFYFKATASL